MSWQEYIHIFNPNWKAEPYLVENQISVLRDDLIHPHVSGNKLRKLWKYLHWAQSENLSITTFGGAFSNHVLATAFACNKLHIKSKAFVRGEEVSNFTLDNCKKLGMEIEFCSRTFFSQIKHKQGVEAKVLFVPEGGAGALGIQGVSESYQDSFQDFDTILLAAGTLTTALGIAQKFPEKQVVAVPVLKATGAQLHCDLKKMNPLHSIEISNLKFGEPAHLGGYAKASPELIDFMNRFWHEKGIPLDPVYTSKAFLWFYENQSSFEGKKVLLIHTGGLQGLAGFQTKVKKLNKNIDYYEEVIADFTGF